MKKLFLVAVSALALASCTKEPTLADRLEGTWLVNDITAAGTVDLSSLGLGLGVTPIVATDQSISATSLFTMVQEPNSVNFVVDAQLEVAAGALTIPFPWQQSGNGTWLAKSGNGVAPDSVIITATDGTITRYEVLSILESAIRLRTTTDITTPAEGSLNLEFSFAKQL
ncbi:MAG: hypothetical protein RJA97_867 [Bacteroidota bacterium]|jgi:hypothetical protein